jgi:protein SCO1/2
MGGMLNMPKKFTLIWGGAVVAAVLIVTVLLLNQPYQFRGALIDPALPAPEIKLSASTGGTFELSSQTSKIVLIFFGYTSCPDVCPTTLSEMKKVRQFLGGDAERVQVIFITVDPERDTQERLSSYLSLFDPQNIGLTGTDGQLGQVWRDYGVFREIDTESQTEAGYLVNHSSRLYLIDQQGNLRLTYPYGSLPEDIAADIDYLIE